MMIKKFETCGFWSSMVLSAFPKVWDSLLQKSAPSSKWQFTPTISSEKGQRRKRGRHLWHRLASLGIIYWKLNGPCTQNHASVRSAFKLCHSNQKRYGKLGGKKEANNSVSQIWLYQEKNLKKNKSRKLDNITQMQCCGSVSKRAKIIHKNRKSSEILFL